jgi:hypothetical protein
LAGDLASVPNPLMQASIGQMDSEVFKVL